MKNEEVLVRTGGTQSPWFWRKDELSYKNFTKLSIIDKKKHIEFLLSIDESERGTNDDYILRAFGPAQTRENIKFLSLD